MTIQHENAAFLIALQSGVPVFAQGQPGTSKTRTTESFANAFGFEYECLIGSQHDPVDIGGLPRVDDTGTTFSYVKPSWYHRLRNAPRGGLLHLDELFDCPPAVQAAFLQILGDGIPNVRIAATGNPIEQSTNGFNLSGPVINRLCWLDWNTPLDSWKHGFLNGWDKLSANFPVLPVDWIAQIPLARRLVVEFLQRQAALAQAYPKDFESNPQPFPSLRSWTNAATLLAAVWSLGGGEDIEDTLIRGTVGSGAAIAFRSYRKTLNLQDPEELLRDPTQYEPRKLRGDIALTTLGSVISAVLRNNTRERWFAGWEIVARQCDHTVDIAAAVAAPLANNKPAGEAVSIPQNVRDKLYQVLA